jgi:hypothetical protein
MSGLALQFEDKTALVASGVTGIGQAAARRPAALNKPAQIPRQKTYFCFRFNPMTPVNSPR